MKQKKWLFVLMLVLPVLGCNLLDAPVGDTVKQSMQSKFDTDPQFRKFHFVVTNVQVASKSGNTYSGIASIKYHNVVHDVVIEVTSDGQNIVWQAQPGAFAFVLTDLFQDE
jgi:hypothetical protein